MLQLGSRKALGAYYTSDPIARMMARWAIRGGDCVIDPSCGDGAFLAAAATTGAGQIIGVELSEPQAKETALRFVGDDRVRIIASDFFAYEPGELCDAIIGNPPFIRYHSFTGAVRERALFACARAGVPISKLTSSWAPFVIASGEHLRPGGRLALVLPTELLHAKYAQTVLRYLRRSFGAVTIITFKERLFPDLSQDTLIVLASEKGVECTALLHIDATSIDEIESTGLEGLGRNVDAGAFLSGRRRIKESFVDGRALEILDELVATGRAQRLGDVVSVDIGYVSGANRFFHLSEGGARENGIPKRFLSPTVFRGRSLRGLSYGVEDWLGGHDINDSGYVLLIPKKHRLNVDTERYIKRGEREKYSEGYKCSIRDPWYVMPKVSRPAAFLTSMSGGRPTIVINDANVLASNSLHVLRPLDPEHDLRRTSLCWLSSIASLSIEIEGHALGGGLLKLEPSEAERVLIPRVRKKTYRRLFVACDKLARAGRLEEAVRIVDDWTMDALNLTRVKVACLRTAATRLRTMRLKP